MFINEIYSKPPMRSYPTNKMVYIHIDEILSVHLGDMIEYKTSKNKGFLYIFIIIDNFSKYAWAIPLKSINCQTLTNEFSNLTQSRRSPLRIESDRGKEWYNSSFQDFLKSKIIHHYSRLTDKSPSIAERVVRTIRNLLKKPIFLAGEASWINELPSIIKKYNNTIQNSTKRTPIQTNKKSNEKENYSNLQDRRDRQTPKFKLVDLVRTADIKRVFTKGDGTNCSYQLYTITEVIQDTIPSYRDIVKTFYYLQNFLSMKTIKL